MKKKISRQRAPIVASGFENVLGACTATSLKNSFASTKQSKFHGQIERRSDGTVDLAAEMNKHPDALWLRVKAIEADRENDNGDYFSTDEILKSYKTFEGVPVFTNHNNQEVEQAKGKVIQADWDPDEKAVYCTMYIDREAHPSLCRAIEEGYITDVSMGTQVEYSTCSHCGNKALTADSYCDHVRTMKGRSLGGKKVYEENYGLKFIEISVVTDGACEDCTIREIMDPNDFAAKNTAEAIPVMASPRQKFIQKNNEVIAAAKKIRQQKAAIHKNGGQQEINLLNTAMDNIESVLRSMLDQRQYIDLEFMSNLSDVFAELQHVTDELVDQGYGSLGDQSQPQQSAIPEIPENVQEQGVGETNDLTTAPSSTGVGTITRPASSSSGASKDSKRLQPAGEGVLDRLRELTARTHRIQEDFGGHSVTREEEKQKTIEKLAKIWAPSVRNFTTQVIDGDFKIVAGKDEIVALKGGKKIKSLKVSSLDKDIQDMFSENVQKTSEMMLDALKSSYASMSKVAESAPVDSNEQWGQTMESQLRDQDLPLHPREGQDRQEITEKQLQKDYHGYDWHKQGLEEPRHDITEKQLHKMDGAGNVKGYDFHSVQDSPREDIHEGQLKDEGIHGNSTPQSSDRDWAEGVSDQEQQITEGQLEDWKGPTSRHLPEHDITEKQLKDQGDPIGRRVASITAENAKEVLSMAMNAISRTASATGATPEEIVEAVNDKFMYDAENAVKIASKMDNDESRSGRESMLRRAAYYGRPRTAKIGDVCDYLLGSLSDENLGAEAGLQALEVIASQEDATTKIGEAIKEDFKLEDKSASKKSSPKDLLKAALKDEPKQVKAGSNKETKTASADSTKEEDAEEVRVIIPVDDIDADPQDAEAFAKAAFAAGKRWAEASNIKIVANTRVTQKKSNVEVTMEGVKTASCACGNEDGECDCSPECECACNTAEASTNKSTATARSKARRKMVEAQFGGGEGGMGQGDMQAGGPASGGGTTMPTQPPGDPSMDPGMGALSEPAEIEEGDATDDNPESMPPGSMCPVCGSDDVNVEGGDFGCNNCGGAGHIEVNMKINKWPDTIQEQGPSEDLEDGGESIDEGIGDMEGGEGIEMPQVGVASVFKITPEMVKVAGNTPIGSYCPHCGSGDTSRTESGAGCGTGSCGSCDGKYRFDTYIDSDEKYFIGRVAWRERGIQRMAQDTANKIMASREKGRKLQRVMAGKRERLATALKAKGWESRFSKASIADQAEMIAELADQGLLEKN